MLTRQRQALEASFPDLDAAIASGGGQHETVEACRVLSYAEKWQAQLQERMAALI